MTRIVLYLIYVLIGIGAGCEIGLYGGGIAGFGGSLLSFLICLQVHSAVLHRRDRKKYESDLVSLRRSGLELEAALAETRGKMDDMSKVLEVKTSAQNRKIVSELKMLENLMREQAGQISDHSSVADQNEEPEPAAGRLMAKVFEGHSEAELLETVRSSLEENRVDLLLQPIVGLPQRKLGRVRGIGLGGVVRVQGVHRSRAGAGDPEHRPQRFQPVGHVFGQRQKAGRFSWNPVASHDLPPVQTGVCVWRRAIACCHRTDRTDRTD